MFTLSIQTYNDAFANGKRAAAIAKLLDVVARRVADGETGGTLLDVNGNSCGAWLLTSGDEQER